MFSSLNNRAVRIGIRIPEIITQEAILKTNMVESA